MIGRWPARSGEEYVLPFDRQRAARILVIPALFDEAHKLRRLTVEVMRRLDGAGHDSFLPDLPGQNESIAPLVERTLQDWQEAAEDAAAHFRATHVLSLRAGALVAPSLPGWRYAPHTGKRQLQALLRARTLTAREAGREENRAALLELGRAQGLVLAGYRLGAGMIRELDDTPLSHGGKATDIDHADVGGTAPWLRAEADFDPEQADALAAIVAMSLAA